MSHKNSFPPRLTENEAVALSGRYTSETTVRRLLNRGLLRLVVTGFDYKTMTDIEDIVLTRRGEKMLARYRLDNGIRELAKLTRKAA